MKIEEIDEKNDTPEEYIDTSSIETIKEISKLVSKEDIEKIMEQIPQEAINQISDEEIKKIKEVKEITPETLAKLSAGLGSGTKEVLKYLGAGAVLATVGIGAYHLGNLNAEKANAQCEEVMKNLQANLKNSYEDGYGKGYKKGYKKGNKIGSINGYNTASKRASIEQLSKKDDKYALCAAISFVIGANTAAQALNLQNKNPRIYTEKDF